MVLKHVLIVFASFWLQLIGYLLSLICFASEHAVGLMCEKFNEQRIFIHDCFMVFCLLATVNVWRGLWGLLDFYTGEWRF